MGELFGVESNTVTYHLKEIFKTKELDEVSVTRNFRATAETEFKKYRVVQDREYVSDFDRVVEKLLNGRDEK